MWGSSKKEEPKEPEIVFSDHQIARTDLKYKVELDDILFKWNEQPEELTQIQYANIASLRAELASFCGEHKDCGYVPWLLKSDRVAMRFLLARKEKVEDAATMFKEAVEFRKKRMIDQVTQLPNPKAKEIFKEYPMTWHKTDKQGRPIYIERTGQIDFQALMQKYKREDLVDWCWHTNEYTRRMSLPRASEQAGKRVDKTLNILDLSGFSSSQISKLAYSILGEFSGGAQLMYPEVMGKMYIINVPFVFYVIWKIVKPWLDPRTKAKIILIKGNGVKEILEDVDEENLPSFLGGKCNCEGEGGCMSNSPEVLSYLRLCELGEEEWREGESYLTKDRENDNKAVDETPTVDETPADAGASNDNPAT